MTGGLSDDVGQEPDGQAEAPKSQDSQFSSTLPAIQWPPHVAFGQRVWITWVILTWGLSVHRCFAQGLATTPKKPPPPSPPPAARGHTTRWGDGLEAVDAGDKNLEICSSCWWDRFPFLRASQSSLQHEKDIEHTQCIRYVLGSFVKLALITLRSGLHLIATVVQDELEDALTALHNLL